MPETQTQRSDYPKLLSPFQSFVHKESIGGIILILAAGVAFLWANSSWSASYFALQEIPFGIQAGSWSLQKPLLLWVNDGLMAVFFLMVGLEIKRELLAGELSSPREAALPMVAAVGGMVVPALIYASLNGGGEGTRGWGIPMATDIAFALGVLSLLGSRVPLSLKVFLTALAIVDDLGAILVIALFYTAQLSGVSLMYSLMLLGLAFVYGWAGGRKLVVFGILGILSWYFMLKSGVHATIAGVLLAFAIPLRRTLDPKELKNWFLPGSPSADFEETEVRIEHLEEKVKQAASQLHSLEHRLEPWVAYLIMPVFALFNAGVALSGEALRITPVTAGVFWGLLLGKPLGIVGISWLAEKWGWVSLPAGVNWSQMAAVGFIAGIGFTMSLFVASLAFGGSFMLDQSKLGVLSASVTAAVTGLILFQRSLARRS